MFNVSHLNPNKRLPALAQECRIIITSIFDIQKLGLKNNIEYPWMPSLTAKIQMETINEPHN